MRARWAPRQKCRPKPKARWLDAFSRRTSSRNGSGNTSGSRLADANDKYKSSPGSNVTSRRVNGSWQFRMKCLTGETYLMISSAASSMISGSDCSSSSWSGCSISASRPPAIALDVVSWPAVAMIT